MFMRKLTVHSDVMVKKLLACHYNVCFHKQKLSFFLRKYVNGKFDASYFASSPRRCIEWQQRPLRRSKIGSNQSETMRSFCNCSQYYSRTFDGTVINYCGRTLKCDTSRTMWLGNARRTTECRNYSVAKIEKILLFSRRNLMLIFLTFDFPLMSIYLF